MKVIDLLEEIKSCRKEYGEDFLDWDVYTEQCTAGDKQFKRKSQVRGGPGWENINDGEGWEYFKCHGFWTKYPKKKVFTVNVNY